MKIADQLREAHRNKKSPAAMLKAADQLESQEQEILQLRQALEKTSKAAQVTGQVGIDFGYSTLATLSSGEKVDHPKEFSLVAKRYGQAQRGLDKRLAARIRERETNRRRDRNHKLSRRLVSENAVIVVSKDNIRGLSRNHFGKSVGDAGHGELRQMLSGKCTKSGRSYIEVSPKNSTKICSSCGSLSGPTGWAGLKVRDWVCTVCGAEHDRDVNAAINTLNAGLGSSLEFAGDRISGTGAIR